jgi:hypothetical protein
METKQFLTEVLGKTYKTPAEKVAELFNSDGTIKDDAPAQIFALDQVRVQEFEAREKLAGDNMYKKAQSEILDMKEKEIKEKFGLNGSKKKGLIEIIEEVATQAAAKAATVDPDKIKLHPEYIKLQDELTAQINSKETEWKQKFEERENQINHEKTFSVINKKADAFLQNFGLPEDQTIANNQKRLLQLELNDYKFTPDSTGNDYVITDKDGKVVNDQHGHRKNFETLVNEIASKYWPKKDGQARSGAGAENNQGGVGAANVNKWKGKVTDDATYSKLISEAKTAEERMEITDAYEDHQGAGK